MDNWEPGLRLGAFAVLLSVFWCAEWFWPRRSDASPRAPRQVINLALVAMNTLLMRLGIPVMATDMAHMSATRHWGLLNWLELPVWSAVLLSFLLLDLIIYWQHRLFHWLPLAWRFHRVHHSDTFFDVTTGIRFHPVEILASMAIKIAVVVALGAPVAAVVFFEVVLNGTSVFNHANLKIRTTVDRAIRLFIVTPDMHRVHHSVSPSEYNRNFGFNLSLWDRVFGSYQPQPQGGHLAMGIGLSRFRDDQDQRLIPLLLQPWARGLKAAGDR